MPPRWRILGKTGPPNHGSGGHGIDGRLRLSGVAVAGRHISQNEAGCDCVDSDAVRAQLQREAARQRNDRRLGRGVEGRTRDRRAVRCDRSQVYDAAEAARLHALHNSARRVN